ncbi:MAG: hypothetical protein H0W73_02515 [Bacteroidetes bacterium]|nr:hypothetical protein [Bacteroidota bacterium]
MNIYLSKEPVMTTSKNNEELYVLIFKTNIELEDDLKLISTYLEKENNVINWNVDREDIDRVLRVESNCDDTGKIIKTINEAGFFCEELN